MWVAKDSKDDVEHSKVATKELTENNSYCQHRGDVWNQQQGAPEGWCTKLWIAQDAGEVNRQDHLRDGREQPDAKGVAGGLPKAIVGYQEGEVIKADEDCIAQWIPVEEGNVGREDNRSQAENQEHDEEGRDE